MSVRSRLAAAPWPVWSLLGLLWSLLICWPLVLGPGNARGLRRARVELDPEIQVLAAEELRSGSRRGGSRRSGSRRGGRGSEGG